MWGMGRVNMMEFRRVMAVVCGVEQSWFKERTLFMLRAIQLQCTDYFTEDVHPT